MSSPTVIPRTDPRARQLLGVCLTLCCGFFVAELIVFLLFGDRLGDGAVAQILAQRNALFALGKGSVPLSAAVGILIHAGMAALMSAALQRMWLRNRGLALSMVLLIFVAFQGVLVALAIGKL
ncbi:MAG TPA: hypothetical protein VE981_02125 [Planctomycetota bacterium]|nr:hypothetical protein [Planctomycetota bacterium]